MELERDRFGWHAVKLPKWRFHDDVLVDWSLSIVERPHYCDRGRFIVYVEAPTIDGADGFPRYYFDWDRMLAELEAWIAGREELKHA